MVQNPKNYGGRDMKSIYMEQIIKILKDCDCPVYHRDQKIWNMGVERSIMYLEFELQSNKLRNAKRNFNTTNENE